MDEAAVLIQEEYEKNSKFNQWMRAYCTYKSITYEDALKDSMVAYSAKYWKEQGEKSAKG